MWCVWNPGRKRAAALPDMEPDGERVDALRGGRRGAVPHRAGSRGPLARLPDARRVGALAGGGVGTVVDERRATAGRRAAGREGLASQLRELEAFVAKTEAAGETMPPAAMEMIARLREIVRALDGLTSSLGDE